MSILSFENVTLGYEGRPIVSGLTFTLNKGDYLSVLGQNGSGKSTMMKALLGFIKPMEGKVICDRKKNHIGYLPQQSATQADFPASVREAVLSGCQGKHIFAPFYSKAEKRLAEENMERLGILPIAGHSFKELSGGQRQRALLARALCAAEDMILLDEPVAGLDPVVTEELYRIIKKLNEEGMTVMMISHDYEHAVKDATHILHLGKQMVYFGKTADYDRVKALKKEGGMVE